MRSELENILKKFLGGANVPPLLLSDESILDAVRFCTGKAISSREELVHEVIDDVFVFAPEEEGESFKIKLARDMSSKAHIKPAGEFKIFVAYDIDDLTLDAANSLLKVFEDIPERTLFLLAIASKEQLPETLLSRMIYIDSNLDYSRLDPAIREKVDGFFRGEKAEFLAFMQASKSASLGQSECLGILRVLHEYVRSGVVRDPAVISAISDAIVTISSTNANARWVLDRVILSLR